MSGSFGLSEFKDSLEVADTHFAVGHNKVEDAQPRCIGAGEKNLGSQVDIKVF